MSTVVRLLAICADDFGLSPGVSRGIATLAQAGRLTATSCLTNMRHWRSSAPRLRELPEMVDVGLHFNLSEGEPLGTDLRRVWPQLPALPGLIGASHLRALPAAAIRAEFMAQLDAFTDLVGRAPDFVDGHQHVHHLPIVRDAVLASLAGLGDRVAVRNTGRMPGPGFRVKKALIARTGGRALQRELQSRGIWHNPVLLGVYDFKPGTYRQRMQGWLAAVPAEGALIFCHPGAADDAGVPDVIHAARGPEADYLASDAFIEDLRAAGVRLGRVWQRVSETSSAG